MIDYKVETQVTFVSPVTTLPPGRFVRILHDYETAFYNYKPRSLFDPSDGLLDTVGYPETVSLRNRVGTQMTEAIQRLWFDQILLAMFGNVDFGSLHVFEKDAALRAWHSLTKSSEAFTNHAGTDVGVDYISGANMGADYPKLFELSCGGNVFELAAPNTENHEGKDWYKVKTLDPATLHSSINFNRRLHPELFHVATISTPFKKDGQWVVDPFPQFANVGYSGDVIFPVFSVGGVNYVDAARVTLMREGDPFPPYPYHP